MAIDIGEIRVGQDEDPSGSGCVRVRIFNRQNDEQNIKDEDLPLCVVAQHTGSAATAGVGMVPGGLFKGVRVLLTYLDWDVNKEHPIVIGTLPRGELPYEDGLGKRADPQSGGKVDTATRAPDSPTPPKDATGIYRDTA